MPVTLGPQQLVNTFVIGAQNSVALAGLADGGWISVWASQGGDGNSFGISQQRYTAFGSPIGGEEVVNAFNTSDQTLPSVAALPHGGWVATWMSLDQDQMGGFGIYQQQYNRDGLPLGGEIRVNQFAPGNQRNPSVAALPDYPNDLTDGGWIVAWQSNGQSGDDDIYYRRILSNGAPAATDIRVNDTDMADQTLPTVTVLRDGGWVVAWEHAGSANGYEIVQRRYGANGNPGVQEVVNGVAAGDQSAPVLAALDDGGWVAAWMSPDQDDTGIRMQRFSQSGARVGGESQVNTFFAGAQTTPRIAGLKDGGFVVTWDSLGQDLLSSWGVYQQRFSAEGARVGGETLVNVASPKTQQTPGIAALADGGWVVAFQDGMSPSGEDTNGVDGDQSGIVQRHFRVSPPQVSLTGRSAAELAKDGAVVGDLPVAGPLDAVSYTLVTDAGGRFSLSGNQLVVKNGLLLDHEQARTHAVTIRATDAAGLSTITTVTLAVTDVSPEVTTGSLSGDTLFGGTGADRISGGLGHDQLKGAGGHDILKGDAGNDRLFGGAGKDTLTGGAGRDNFVFDTKPALSNVDRITDFNVRDDTVFMDNAAFTKIGRGTPAKPLKLSADAFHSGAKAADPQDRVIYDPLSGKLWYDQDGSGGKGHALVAQLSKGLKMTPLDFYVI